MLIPKPEAEENEKGSNGEQKVKKLR